MNRNPNLNLATGNNFQLVFSQLPFDDETPKDFVLHVYETVLPGISFSEDIQSWQGWDLKSIVSNLNFNNWTINFDVDENFSNWIKIFDWMNHINNNKDKAGNSLKNYCIDSSLVIYDNYGKSILKFNFSNMFPLDLGDIILSYRQGDVYLTSTSTFVYTNYQIDKNI